MTKNVATVIAKSRSSRFDPIIANEDDNLRRHSNRSSSKPVRAPMLLGKKGGSGDGNLKAAKTIRKKAVYCVDKIDTSCSVEDVRSFVSGLRIEVYSCFEVKSRRRRNEEIIGERKAFRLCIPDDDRGKLLNAADWPDSVTDSEWYFKQANDESDKRRRVDANSVDEASVWQATICIVSIISIILRCFHRCSCRYGQRVG